MCETLQLNWKLPAIPVETISSTLSAIKDNNTYTRLNNGVTKNRLSSSIKKLGSSKNQSMTKKENVNNNRTNTIREKNSNKPNQKSAILKDAVSKTSNRKADGKYILRECSIKKRNEIEVKKSQPKKRGPKPRPKPQPMSKYRRKTANAKERERMKQVNDAFERLRVVIPNQKVGFQNLFQ